MQPHEDDYREELVGKRVVEKNGKNLDFIHVFFLTIFAASLVSLVSSFLYTLTIPSASVVVSWFWGVGSFGFLVYAHLAYRKFEKLEQSLKDGTVKAPDDRKDALNSAPPRAGRFHGDDGP